MPPRSCPACARGGAFPPLEEHLDKIGGGTYVLHSCPGCGVVFSEPRAAVGPDWYEKAAPLRAGEGRSDPATDWRFLTFLRLAGAPGKVLDVGCGDGGFLAVAAEAGWTGVGFDHEARMVALAKARGLDAHAADFADFARSRAPGEFDAVTLFDVLEHAPEPAELLALVRPLLKAGGVLAITLPNASRPIPFKREEHDYPPHHFTRWTPAALRGFFERGGFEVAAVDAGTLHVSWLSDQLYFNLVAPALLSLYKRMAFGAAAEGKTVSEAYAATGRPGALADPSRRQRLVRAGKSVAKILTWPAAALLWPFYGLRRDAGEQLFLLARRR